MFDSAEAADRLSRRRVRVLNVLLIFFALQSARLPVDIPHRAVEYVGLFGWLAMALVMMLVLSTGGMWLRDPEVRRLADDEVTRANRREAMEWGFTAAIGLAIAGTIIASLTAMPAVFALRTVVFLGLFIAIVRFVRLERAALA
jgi:hypothetical protein